MSFSHFRAQFQRFTVNVFTASSITCELQTVQRLGWPDASKEDES